MELHALTSTKVSFSKSDADDVKRRSRTRRPYPILPVIIVLARDSIRLDRLTKIPPIGIKIVVEICRSRKILRTAQSSKFCKEEVLVCLCVGGDYESGSRES